MNRIITRIAHSLGIDGAIFYTSSSQIISAIGGLVTPNCKVSIREGIRKIVNI